MKTFNYTARTSEGRPTEGVVEANTQADAIASLRGDGLVVTAIDQAKGDNDIDLRLGGRKTKEKTIALMCKQFSIIMRAGLPIVRSVQLVAEQVEDKTLKVILGNVADEVSAGYSLADSFQKHGSHLPDTFIETIRAGEESGNLDVMFERLSRYYEKSSRTKSKVVSAMIYPCFTMAIAVVVVIIIMVFAVPAFTSSLESMGGELPFITVALIAVSDFFVKYWIILIAAIVAAIMAFKFALKNDDFRLKWSGWGLRVPIMGRVNRMNGAAQFSSTMSTMLTAGLPVTDSVAVTARSLSSYALQTSLLGILTDLESGKRLATSMDKTETWPDLLVEMTAVGEETGSLENTLDVISDYYDNEVETATSRAMSLLEPAIIVVLAIVVCLLLLAVYLPMFSMYSMF